MIARCILFAGILVTPFCSPLLTPARAVDSTTAPTDYASELADKRVLMLGDSITQDGRYASYFEYFLQKYHSDRNFDLVAAGLASETVSGLSEPGHAGGAFPRPDLNERLERALTDVKPRLVIACYGMNDGVYQPFDAKRFDAFKAGIGKLLEATRKHGAKLILVTPSLFENNDGATHYEEVLRRYSHWEIASTPAGVLKAVDIHTPLAATKAKLTVKEPKFHYTRDGVHPDDFGHYLMAVYLARGLGLKTPDDTAESFTAVRSDPLFKAVAARRSARSEAWRKYIGYKREKNVPPHTGDIAAAEKQAFESQAKIDALRRR